MQSDFEQTYEYPLKSIIKIITMKNTFTNCALSSRFDKSALDVKFKHSNSFKKIPTIDDLRLSYLFKS